MMRPREQARSRSRRRAAALRARIRGHSNRNGAKGQQDRSDRTPPRPTPRAEAAGALGRTSRIESESERGRGRQRQAPHLRGRRRRGRGRGARNGGRPSRSPPDRSPREGDRARAHRRRERNEDGKGTRGARLARLPAPRLALVHCARRAGAAAPVTAVVRGCRASFSFLYFSKTFLHKYIFDFIIYSFIPLPSGRGRQGLICKLKNYLRGYLWRETVAPLPGGRLPLPVKL
jgi:hypothetical protein